MKKIGLLLVPGMVGMCLTSCQLANAALKAPGTLLKGMGGAVSRSVGLGSNTTAEKPVMDSESLRKGREYLEQAPTAAPEVLESAGLAQNDNPF